MSEYTGDVLLCSADHIHHCFDFQLFQYASTSDLGSFCGWRNSQVCGNYCLADRGSFLACLYMLTLPVKEACLHLMCAPFQLPHFAIVIAIARRPQEFHLPSRFSMSLSGFYHFVLEAFIWIVLSPQALAHSFCTSSCVLHSLLLGIVV